MPWAKGQSGNPGGRPPVAKEIRDLAQADSKKAYQVVLGMMLGADKDSTRLAAAIAILKMAGVTMNHEDGQVTMTLPAPVQPQEKGKVLKMLTSPMSKPLTPPGDSEN